MLTKLAFLDEIGKCKWNTKKLLFIEKQFSFLRLNENYLRLITGDSVIVEIISDARICFYFPLMFQVIRIFCVGKKYK